MSDPRMTVQPRTVEGVTVMELAGRLDESTSALLLDHLEKMLSPEPQDLVLDLGRLSYLSSAGLRVLVVGARRTAASSRRLILADVPNMVYMVFDVSGLNKIFAFAPSVDEAVGLITAGRA